MPLFFSPGNAPSSKVYHCADGFYYHLNNNRPSRRFAYFRCIHYGRKALQCPGTAKVLVARKKLYHLNAHSHPPNPLYPYVVALKRDILSRVRGGDQTSPGEIMQQEGQKYPMAVRSQVAMGSIISRVNAIRIGLRPPVPRSLGVLGACLLLPQYRYLTQCLHVPESLFASMCGKLADRTLSLVFVSEEMKAFMQTRKMVFTDGTKRKLFRKPKASQIYVISAAYRFHAVVMLRAIMQSRIQEAYEVLYDYVLELMPLFDPDSFKCDFEVAHMNALYCRFPNASVEGCLWHYAIAVYLYAKNKLGLYHLIRNFGVLEGIVRCFGALPLLETEEIEPALEELGAEAVEEGWMPVLRPLFQYWVREWVPKIPVLSVAGSDHRTNNISESSNRIFNREVKETNPGYCSVLRGIVTTNERYTCDLYTLAGGLEPARGRKISCCRNNIAIRRAMTDYHLGDISRVKFLHKASRSLQNVFNSVYR